MNRPLTVCWIPDFPVEWLPDLPAEWGGLPKSHPASWQRVLWEEFAGDPRVRLHIVVMRKTLPRSGSFAVRGTTFHLVKMPGGLRAPTFFWLDTLVVRRLLRRIQPDVVHAWGSEKGAALVASRLGWPYVVTVQGLMSWYAETVPLNRYERFATFLERLSLPRAPVVTTESRFAVGYLREKFPNLRIAQVEHAPAPLFSTVRRAPQLDPLRLLFVGEFGFRKGADLILRALDTLAEEFAFELVVIGPWRPAMRELLATLPRLRDRVITRNGLTPSEVADEMARATMMIFATRADTSPNAVKEAVVAGLPVVASAVGGILDYVQDGKNGLLFPSGDLAGLIAAARAAFRDPRFSRGEVDAGALAEGRSYLAAPQMAEGFLGAYRTVIGR